MEDFDMYAGGRKGMGMALDWTQIINTGINAVGRVVAPNQTVPIGYNGYPAGSSYSTAGGSAGMGIGTLALLGVGAFFLIKAMKR